MEARHKQVQELTVGGKSFKVGDKVFYQPNHAKDRTHPDCERGVVTSLRTDGGIWVRFEKQHIEAPGQRTSSRNLEVL